MIEYLSILIISFFIIFMLCIMGIGIKLDRIERRIKAWEE